MGKESQAILSIFKNYEDNKSVDNSMMDDSFTKNPLPVMLDIG